MSYSRIKTDAAFDGYGVTGMFPRMVDQTSYEAPTPGVFYIHDDLSDDVLQVHGSASPAYRLTQELFRLVSRDPKRVMVLHLADQIAMLLAQADHSPFDLTVGIGRAGARVARQLHERTGWFPRIRQVDVTREEDGYGGYNVVSTTSQSLTVQLGDLSRAMSLAVVDDTVFSGLTMQTILSALPAEVLQRTQAFCLRGVAESLPRIRALCPLAIGFAAPGRLLQDVSFINATGLVLRVGIRRAGQPGMAFFERPEWMHAWFPGYAEEVVAVCQRLNALLEPTERP
jgi:adenine/guanine phosphoribosyltransferase-like PRPP-binding protein